MTDNTGDIRLTDPTPRVAPHPLRYPATLIDWARGFSLHVLTGFLAVAAHYALMWLLLKLGAAPLLASSTGFVAGALTRYLLSFYKIFTPTGSVPATLVKFVAALGAQMAANLTLLDLIMHAGANLWLAQVSATIILTFVNFIVYRLWVFK
ncbi:MAG: GtrA family protein [Hydrogenophilales bacterium]|nr:GtrA family protein [Hydrogenophilales bacterium]